MTESFTTRKEFVRLHAEFPVRYKFLSKEVEIQEDAIFEGITARMGGMDSFFTARSPASTGSPPC